MSFTHQPRFPPPSPLEDEHVDIDVEPWTHSYISIPRSRYYNLQNQARHLRGVTAFQSSPHLLITQHLFSSSHQHTYLSRTSPTKSFSALDDINSYSLHTTLLLPRHLSHHLSDPLNTWAGLGILKPYVHLFGPPLDVATDARISGSQSRFARNETCHIFINRRLLAWCPPVEPVSFSTKFLHHDL